MRYAFCRIGVYNPFEYSINTIQRTFYLIKSACMPIITY